MQATLDDQASDMLADLEQWERRRVGSIDNARRSVARKIGLSEGVLERVRRRRLKGVRAYVIEKIREAFLPEVAAEQQRLARAVALFEGSRLGVATDAAREARAALRDAERFLAEAKKQSD